MVFRYERNDSMSTKTAALITGRARNAYLQLVGEFPLTSIRTERHFQAAQKVMDRILASGKLSAGATAYVDALSDLVGAYEDVHHPLPPASDADLLRHLLEAKGVTQTELCRATKLAPSVISEVLSGKRPFSKDMVGKLARYFGVDRSVLVANF
jgi:HTH-type transcriptional regulator/antitoxin HigA